MLKVFRKDLNRNCITIKVINDNNLSLLIDDNYENVFKNGKELGVGINKAFNGNWGAQAHTKRQGIVQGLDRLSFNLMMSHLRKIVLPLDPQLKVVEPRKLYSLLTQ